MANVNGGACNVSHLILIDATVLPRLEETKRIIHISVQIRLHRKHRRNGWQDIASSQGTSAVSGQSRSDPH